MDHQFPTTSIGESGDEIPNGLAPKVHVDGQREALADAGDFAALYSEILHARWNEVSANSFLRLFRAIDMASRDETARFAKNLLRVMITSSAFLAVRVQAAIITRITESDEQNRRGTGGGLPADVSEYLLPQLLELQSHVAALCQAQAATARQWELAKHKQVQSEHNGRSRK